MPSTWSMRFRLNYQAPGDNLNAWGLILNQQVFQALEDAIAKRVAFPLSGSKTLTTVNGLEDEARCAHLDVTGGAGGVIVIPSVEKWYVVRNGASGDVTVTTGAGSEAKVFPGEILLVVCDAANVRRAAPGRVIAAPTNASDIVNKAYADALAFNSVELPGQGGNSGRYIRTDGTNASWADIGMGNVEGLDDALTPATGPQIIGGAVADRFVAPDGLFDAAAPVPVAYATTVTLDLDTGINFDIGTLTGNLTLANFLHAKPGQSGVIRIAQDATGGRTLSVGSNLKRAGGAMSLTPAANASDRVYYFVWSPSLIDLTIARAFS